MSCADGYTLHDTGTVCFEWWDWVRIMLSCFPTTFSAELRLHRGCTTLTTTNATTRTRQREAVSTTRVSADRKDVWTRSQSKRRTTGDGGRCWLDCWTCRQSGDCSEIPCDEPKVRRPSLPSSLWLLSAILLARPQALILFIYINVVLFIAWGVRLPSRPASLLRGATQTSA